MSSLVKRTTILVALSLAASGAASFGAMAQERCSGTFCDLFYGGAAPQQPAAPAQPKPLTMPSTLSVPKPGFLTGLFSGGGTPQQPAAPGSPPQAAKPSLFQGGGLLSSEPQGRCTGTFCDAYYGGSSPPPPQPAQPGIQLQPGTVASRPQAAPQQTQAAAPQPEEEVVEAPDPTPRRAAGVQYERPACVGTAADPWKCYRR